LLAPRSLFLRIDLLLALLAFPLLSAGCGPRQVWGVPVDVLKDSLARAEYSALASVDFTTQDPGDAFAISPEAPFYLSFVFDSLDRPAQSLRMLELAWSRCPNPWKQEAGVLLAQRYSAGKSYDRAIETARRLLSSSPAPAVGERARRALVEALYWNKDDTAVLQEAARLAAPDPEVLLFRAVSSLRLHLDAAPGLVLQLFTRERASTLHGRVDAFLTAEPAYLQLFTAGDQDLLAAKDALSRGDWGKGIPVMANVLGNLDPARVTSALVLDFGASCAAAGSFETGAELLDQLAPRLTGPARVDALEQAGRLSHRARDDGKAVPLLRAAAAEATAAAQRDRARWALLEIIISADSPGLLGQIETEAASWNDPSYFSDLLERKVAQLVAEKSWRILARFRDTAQKIGLPELYAELSYIVARAWQEGEIARLPGTPTGTARELLSEAVKASPSGYYGIMAASVLGDLPDRAIPAPQTEPPAEKPVMDPLTEGYIAFGLTRQAYARLWGARDTLSDAQVLEAARRLAQAGDARSSLYMVGALARRRRLSREELELYYPRPYDTIIEPLAFSAEIPDPLLYGLVREESYFDPDIISAAGAVGLSQLMPATAADIAARLHMADPDLTDPTTNLTLGVRHFKDLLARLESPARALLAYNAGLGRERQWERASRGLPEDLFFESVPIAETRQYVRKILVSSVMYAFLYKDADPRDVALSFFRVGRRPLEERPAAPSGRAKAD
jgi:soluble lytic murein transglycosylase-like protein